MRHSTSSFEFTELCGNPPQFCPQTLLILTVFPIHLQWLPLYTLSSKPPPINSVWMASFCPRLFSSADIFFKCLFPRWFNVTLNVADFHLHTNQSKDLVFMETVVLRNSSCPEIIEPLLVSSSPTWSQHSGLHCPSSQGSPDGCHLL